MLAKFFLAKFTARIGKRVDRISPALLAKFEAYAWPGNIRELENLVERAVILANGDTLDVDTMPFLFAEAAPPLPASGVEGAVANSAMEVSTDTWSGASLGASIRAEGAIGAGGLRSMAAMEREHVLAALAKSNWVIGGAVGAARLLDLHPNTLRSRMDKLGIVRPKRGGG